MPEYLAPGVFVEEVSYRAKSIEGVSTTTTAFIGPTRDGPTDIEPELVTSLVEFERIYGDRGRLYFGEEGVPMHNYVWHAVRAFFEGGGKRVYVQRVFRPNDESDSTSGFAATTVGSLTVRARFPGRSGARRVRITLGLGPNALAAAAAAPSALAEPVVSPPESPRAVLRGLRDGDVVWISPPPALSPPEPRSGALYLVSSTQEATGTAWTFTPADDGDDLTLDDLDVDLSDGDGAHEVRRVFLTVTVDPTQPDSLPLVWGGLSPDQALHQFHPHPENTEWRRSVPIVFDAGLAGLDGLELLAQLFAAAPTTLQAALETSGTGVDQRTLVLLLTDGDDGVRPTAAEYEGNPRDIDDKAGLKAFEDLEEVSIVAAPGSTFGFDDPEQRPQSATIVQLLIAHAERMRYRIAVIDSGDGQNLTQVRAMRAALDSKHAAIYYPWVRILDPVTQEEISVPPSGFVAGIYARNDIERAVYKAPANEIVRLAIGFERTLNTAQQEVLNPEGINCLRSFEGRGNRVWGARTLSSDPEWKYVNLRRYFAYLERSIDIGTQWAVFEPNGPSLWANVRRTVSDFLFNEFVLGAYLGDKPETSYFVKCDRSTMTQNDIDNGRLVCLVGVAVVRPAEFVIFRVGQWTADARR